MMACPRPALLRLARWCGVPDTRPLFSGARPMKYGLNLLLWTDRMHDGLVPVVEKVKALGYDGVEMPIFELNEPLHAQWGKRLDDLGLERMAVTVRNAGDNPISPSAPVWAAAVDAMKKTIDCCRAAGVKTLCGPTHSAIGDQRIHRHRADRR